MMHFHFFDKHMEPSFVRLVRIDLLKSCSLFPLKYCDKRINAVILKYPNVKLDGANQVCARENRKPLKIEKPLRVMFNQS